jgi:hypothetical protein
VKRVFALLAALVLLGCSDDQKKQQLAKCEVQAKKTYPSFMDAPSGEPLNTIKLCMGAAGYAWIGTGPHLENLRCHQSNIMMGLPDDVDDEGGDGAHCFRSHTLFSN